MDKGLEALKRIIGCSTIESHTKKWQQDYQVVEKELKALEIIEQKGIAFLVPESDYNNERIHIELYTNTLSEEQLTLIKEVLGL